MAPVQETIVGGAQFTITAALTGTTDPISWTLSGAGVLSTTTGTSTDYTPPADGPVGEVRVTATAGALSAEASIYVRPAPRRSIVAYALASDPTLASYTPPPAFSYNGLGGAITATRSGVGTYQMSFAGLNLGQGTVQVTAYQSAAACFVTNWGGTTVNVSCRSTTNAPVDSRYLVSVSLDGVPSAASIVAYAWANQLTSASYAPSASYAFNVAGGEITATRSAPGTYSISFADLPIGGAGHVQVTAYNSDHTCTVQGWAGSAVNVTCYNASGTLSDSRYVITVIRPNVFSTATVMAYASADQAGSSSYVPSATYRYNASGGAITATRSEVGVYRMTFSGLQLDSGAVNATAYDPGRECTVRSWGAESVQVNCYDIGSGAAADSRYTVQVVQNAVPIQPRIVAYARADEPGTMSYTPDSVFSYNAGGGAITASRSGTGVYGMTFLGLPLESGTVQVTAYGDAAATCQVQGWSGSGVLVRCFNAAGAAVDSRYVVTVLADGVASEAEIVAYVWADLPGSASYSPFPDYLYNAGGGPTTITRSSAGAYTVTFDSLALFGGAVQVSAYGQDRLCVVQSWGGSAVNVRCYGPDGAPADSRFTLSYVRRGVRSQASAFAYAWANNQATASYTPNQVYSSSASTGPVTATRSGPGAYVLRFAGLRLDRGTVKVTPYGSGFARCSVVEWSLDQVEVACVGAGGTPADARYTLTYTE